MNASAAGGRPENDVQRSNKVRTHGLSCLDLCNGLLSCAERSVSRWVGVMAR